MYDIKAEEHVAQERRQSMTTIAMEQVLEEWATAWSSHDTEKLLALFTDDCIYEDVTFSTVNRGREALRAFANGTFAVVPDFTVELTSRFAAETWGVLEWVISGTHQRQLARDASHWQALLRDTGGNHLRTARRQDPALLRLLGCRDVHEAGRSAACTIRARAPRGA